MDQKEIKNYHKKLKKAFFVLFALILVGFIFFRVGFLIGGERYFYQAITSDENLYLGKVLGADKFKQSENITNLESKDIDFDTFWDVWDSLKKNYVDQEDVSEKKLFYGALRGMVSAVGDPYTVFMDPKISKEFAEDMAGTFEGIGAEISIKKDILTIVAPLPDMPAEKAGLKSGDKVLAINGTSTMGIYIDEAVSRIRGPKGTDVVLTIAREGMEGVKDITITRGKIIVNSIKTNLREDGIYVIEVSNFNDDTSDLFNKAIREIAKKNPKGIILDLRNNPGGYLDTSIEMASEWIEEGVVVSEKYGDESVKVNEHLARGRARLKEFPTVVLVNQGSASASEIVAGALQDYDKAKLVGMQSFGKGSVQSLNNFKDGSSLKITVAKWLTPGGRSINDEGIMPDYEVDLTLENYENEVDPQFDIAVAILNGEEINIDDLKASSTEEKVE